MNYSERPDGKTLILIGVPRSGKSILAKEIAKQSDRVIAFCPKGEYASQLGFERIMDKAELIRRVREVGAGPAKINFVASSKADFDFFCGVAWIFNMYERAVLVCEELAMYTNVGKADGNWGRLTCQALAYGPLIVGTVQRGQEVDKTVMNNASMIHVLQHTTEGDREYISKRLGVPIEDIPKEPLQFIQWTSSKGKACSGRIDFPKAKKGNPRFRESGRNGRLLSVGSDGLFNQVKYT